MSKEYATFGGTSLVHKSATLVTAANIFLGPHCTIKAASRIDASNGRVTLGNNVVIEAGATLVAPPEGLWIGDGSSVGGGCEVRARAVGSSVRVLGPGTVVGAGCIIHDGVTVQPGTLVPEGMRIPPYSTVAGDPAAVVDITLSASQQPPALAAAALIFSESESIL
jgi:carbonic anhydrase/acetyltransferase-like protein (isoleucine patch superfamily)